MHIIPFEIPPPKNEADFERMCAQVYGVVFNDRMPKMNGRRGQVQGGVDLFVKELGLGRVGIQCKKYTMKPVKWTDVEDEVEKADKRPANTSCQVQRRALREPDGVGALTSSMK